MLTRICSINLGQIHQQSSEILTNDGWKSIQSDMPLGIQFHCMVLVNETSAMVIGGDTSPSANSNRTFFFDFINQIWSQGPDLKTGRHEHVCGMVNKDKNSDEVKMFT